MRWISYVFPARYYVALLQTVFLTGDIWGVIWPNAGMLALMAAILLVGDTVVTRKELA